jgi:HEAT repeat protein
MIVLLLLALAPRDEMTDLIARLRATPEAQQYTLGIQLGPLAKLSHLPLLAKEADAGPDNLRPFFIKAIGRVGGEEAKTVLRGLCMRNDFNSRAEAATQLTRLQDPAGRTVLLELLPKATTDADKAVVVGRLYSAPSDSGDAVPVLIRFLEKETVDALRRTALRALSSYKDPAALAVVRKIAADPKDTARFEAMAELIKRGDDPALEDAVKALESQKLDLSSLYSILNGIEAGNKRSVLPRLRDLLEKSEDRNLRMGLMRTLGTMKDDKALPLLTKLSQDQDATIAKIANESIVRLSGRAQSDAFRKADDSDPLRKLDGAEALIQADAPEGWAAVRAALEGGSTTVKLRAVSILSGVRRKEAVEILVTLLDDPTESVRSFARTSMISTLTALYPYLKFDYQAPADKLKLWWEKNRR